MKNPEGYIETERHQDFNPALRRQWQTGLCEFQSSLVCIEFQGSQDCIVRPYLIEWAGRGEQGD